MTIQVVDIIIHGKSCTKMLPVRETGVSGQKLRCHHGLEDEAVDIFFIKNKAQSQTIDGFPTLHALFIHGEREHTSFIFTFLLRVLPLDQISVTVL